MRISNKYLRNRLAKTKARFKAKRLYGEHSIKTYMPYGIYGCWYKNVEEQFKDQSDYIDELAITFSSGGHRFHATKDFKRVFERSNRRKIKYAITKIMQGVEDVEFPTFKQDADWEWF